MSDPTPTPSHEFIRPGQVAPECPAPDACMLCGQPEAAHYVVRADADPVYDYQIVVARAQTEYDQRIANLTRDLRAGDVTIREASDERVLILSEHLARLIRLRIEYLGE